MHSGHQIFTISTRMMPRRSRHEHNHLPSPYPRISIGFGLGGYSNEGFAWRYYLPKQLKFRASNNLLEHIMALITPWVDIIAGRLTCGDCVLLMTDSTTSEVWLKKTNFIEDSKSPIQETIRLEVACLHALHYLSHKI
jgi:hypothetical protein